MTQGTLSTQVVINGKIQNDSFTFHTVDMNNQLAAKSTTVAARTAFYAQWALANAGFYNGPINGIVGTNGALYNAFVAAYNQGYSGSYPAPANNKVSFAFFKAFMQDYLPVDPTIYVVVD